ncbi:MAG: hypothetical protein R3C56_19545 [Pirellulaceae bacterium]
MAAKVMREMGDICTDDLHGFAKSNAQQLPANVHYTPVGSEQLADHVSASIRSALARCVPQRINEEHAPSIRVMPLFAVESSTQSCVEKRGSSRRHSRLESLIPQTQWFKGMSMKAPTAFALVTNQECR